MSRRRQLFYRCCLGYPDPREFPEVASPQNSASAIEFRNDSAESGATYRHAVAGTGKLSAKALLALPAKQSPVQSSSSHTNTSPKGKSKTSTGTPCPPVPPAKGNEQYFLAPYPSAAMQSGVRTDQTGAWYKGATLYPLPVHWTNAPDSTWPPSLENFHSRLQRSEYATDAAQEDARVLAIVSDLEMYYAKDQAMLAFTKWLRWQLAKVGQVELVSKPTLKK